MMFIISQALKFTGKKQLQVVPLKNTIVMKTVKLTDSNVIQKIIESGNLQTDGFKMPAIPWIESDVVKYATIKKLAVTIDGKLNVLLLTKNIPNSAQKFSGVVGTIYQLRGGTTAGLIATSFQVSCTRAYFQVVAKCSGDNKVGTCEWNGEKYLAIGINHLPSSTLLFSGIYTDDCIFKNVLESEITWL